MLAAARTAARGFEEVSKTVSKSLKDLSGLVSAGRVRKGVPASRSEVLAALLRKRATAWRSGLSELEGRLRNQILWALPIETPQDRDGEIEPEPTGPATADASSDPAARD